MIRHFVFVNALLLILNAVSIESACASPEKDKYFAQLLAKDPHSEGTQYDYAHYLYENEKFDLALQRIGNVLKLNPQHAKAMRLKGKVEELKKITDPNARKKIMMDFAMLEMNEAVNDLKKASGKLEDSFAPGAIEAVKDENESKKLELDQKFGISQSVESCHPFDNNALNLKLLGSKYRMKGLKDEALKLYRNGLEKQESVELRLSILGLLLPSSKYGEVAEELNKAVKIYPRDVRFQIYQDGLEKIKSAASSEAKSQLEISTLENVQFAEEILADSCSKLKK